MHIACISYNCSRDMLDKYHIKLVLAISTTAGFSWSRVKGQNRAKTKTSLKPPPQVSPVAEAFGVVCGPTGCCGPWCCKTWPGKRTTFRVPDGPKLVFFFLPKQCSKTQIDVFPKNFITRVLNGDSIPIHLAQRSKNRAENMSVKAQM